MDIVFLLNGAEVRLSVAARPELATTTLLDWLREERGLRGTKEGCNEGDCGACSVMVTGPAPETASVPGSGEGQGGAREGLPRALNACILFLPQLHGKAVRTVEGIAAPDGTLHPVQEAMIAEHGSQCGFCTPGFVVTMATAHARGETDHADQLAGNLCRCTGYAPILRAAEVAQDAEVPGWVKDKPPVVHSTSAAQGLSAGQLSSADTCVAPESADALAEWYAAHPDATLVAGATDVGLWVTKGMRDLGPVAFLHRCRDLQRIEERDDGSLRIGAAVTLSDLKGPIDQRFPSFGELIRRYGSVQVRNAATIGGNIANGSPIGDGSPALIALGARLHLRRGSDRRTLPLEDFFVAYGTQDRAPGEFVEAIEIPGQADDLKCYKLSKRFDQDISAVCGCFVIRITSERVTEARIAFGGLAGIPMRAKTVEQVLTGQSWTEETLARAQAAMAEDFKPIDDMRASARYRALAANHMLRRFFVEKSGARANVLEVS